MPRQISRLRQDFSDRMNKIYLSACDAQTQAGMIFIYPVDPVKKRKFLYYELSALRADFSDRINRIYMIFIYPDYPVDPVKKRKFLYYQVRLDASGVLHDVMARGIAAHSIFIERGDWTRKPWKDPASGICCIV